VTPEDLLPHYCDTCGKLADRCCVHVGDLCMVDGCQGRLIVRV
jgi:hypothetical protein